MVRVFGVWFALACVAVAFGFAREAWLTPALGALYAHQLGTVLFCGAILGIGYAAFPLLKLANAKQAWAVGAAWVTMTVAFEFVFGHYVAGHSWSALLADYNFFRGRIWALVLLITGVAPVIAFRLRAGR